LSELHPRILSKTGKEVCFQNQEPDNTYAHKKLVEAHILGLDGSSLTFYLFIYLTIINMFPRLVRNQRLVYSPSPNIFWAFNPACQSSVIK
jgi:hypothetical protein